MGDNNRPTVRIGAKVIGDVEGTVTQNGQVKIEIDGANNFDVGDLVQGKVKAGATVTNLTKIDQTVATESNSQAKQDSQLKDYQTDTLLRHIGDTIYIGSSVPEPGKVRTYNTIGAVTIAKNVTGKACSNLTYNGDGRKYSPALPKSCENLERIDSNIGSITEVEKCNEIYQNSNVTVASRNKYDEINPSVCFDRTNRNIGHMTIFNQESFANPDLYRVGSKEDADALERTFSKFGVATSVKWSLKLKEITQEINLLSNTDFTGLKLFLCVLMSHGKENGFISAYDKCFDHRKIIINPILKNKTLNGVPKIFIIVACRGPSRYYHDADSDHEDGCLLSTRDGISYADLLICYSTYDGHTSKRRSTGTYYIQTLCNILKEEDGPRTDIHSILARVNAILSKEQEIQVPIFESTMGVFAMQDLLLD